MKTDDLIEALADDVQRIPQGQAAQRVIYCALAGLLVTLAAVWLTLGFRPDLAAIADEAGFLMRQAYALAVAGFGSLLLLRLGQPAASVRLPVMGLAITALIIVSAVVFEQAALSGSEQMEAWLGQSWRYCSLRVVGISLVATPFVFFAGRRLAPGRPTLAGFAAGLVAGALASSAYAFYCPEATASFLVSWYTLGMLAASAIGAVVGRILLRW